MNASEDMFRTNLEKLLKPFTDQEKLHEQERKRLVDTNQEFADENRRLLNRVAELESNQEGLQGEVRKLRAANQVLQFRVDLHAKEAEERKPEGGAPPRSLGYEPTPEQVAADQVVRIAGAPQSGGSFGSPQPKPIHERFEELEKRVSDLHEWQVRAHNDTGPLETTTQVQQLTKVVDNLRESVAQAPNDGASIWEAINNARQERAGINKVVAELNDQLTNLERYAKRIEDGYSRGIADLASRVTRLENPETD